MADGTLDNRPHDSGDDASVVVQPVPQPLAAESDADADASQPNTTTAAAADSSTVVAEGLSSMLSSVIRDFDSRAEDTARSQDQLTFALDRLTRELDQLLEDAPLPFIMQHAVKISGVRKRVSSLNTVLKSIQRRLDNIDRMLSVGLVHDNVTAEGGAKLA